MRDRTLELGHHADSDSDQDEQKVFITVSSNGSKDETEINEQFFQTSRDIRSSLQRLGDKVKELEASQVKILTTPLPEEGMKKDLQALREEIKYLAKDIRTKLQSIEVKEDDESVRSSVHARVRKTQHGVLSQKFIEIINQCNGVQTQYRDSNIKRIKRQLQITGHSVTDEQFDQMLESGQTDVFTCNILQDTQVTKQALNEIEARHEEIVKLEKSIIELHEMFLYLAMEVEAQGETIDNIEKNILQSTDYVEKAREQLSKAVVNKQKARKKKVYIAICVSVALLVITIIIMVSVMA
ncbi:syntaxin-4 [Spea bombifrons]|uniref:syntaxin-4 n=1 Tax=Spea bombifrons TaxID=233779 RepID=UPI00234A2BDC|nr:syntaxin-4 [Spea bombifrons]